MKSIMSASFSFCVVLLVGIALFASCIPSVYAGSSIVVNFRSGGSWQQFFPMNTPALFGTEPILKDTTGILIPAGYQSNGLIDPTVSLGCNPFNVADNPKWQNAVNASLNVILIVQRGVCKFELKVLNAQKATWQNERGGNVVGVLVADLESNWNNKFLDYMNDAGDGVSVKIPSALVQYNDSTNVISWSRAADDTYAVMEFFLPTEDGFVEYVLISSVLDADKNSVSNATTFKITMGEVARQIKGQAVLTYVPLLAYTSVSSQNCVNLPPRGEIKICLKNENIGSYFGPDLIRESIRQYIISQTLLQMNVSFKIYDYWNRFYDTCARSPSTFNVVCSDQALLNSGVAAYISPSTLLTTYENTAEGAATAIMNLYNTYRPVKEPALFINHVAYHGTVGNCQPPLTQIQCDYVQWICAGYYADDQPNGCKTDVDCPFGQTKDWCSVCNGTNDCKSSSGVTLAVLFGIILVALIIIGTTIYLYVQKQQRVTKNEVDTLLRQYLPTDSGLGNALSSADIKKTQQTRLINDNASEL